MKKKILLLLIIIIVLSISAVFLLQIKSKGNVSDVLSERSKEFIKEKSEEQGSNWSAFELEKDNKKDSRNAVFSVDNCFSFIMLYKIYNQRSERDCQSYYAFNNPKGTIVTYLRQASNIGSVDGAEGVSFRRKMTDDYEESAKEINGKNFLIFKSKKEPYMANAYYYYPGYFLVFNLSVPGGGNLDSDLEKMLSSIEIYK